MMRRAFSFGSVAAIATASAATQSRYSGTKKSDDLAGSTPFVQFFQENPKIWHSLQSAMSKKSATTPTHAAAPTGTMDAPKKVSSDATASHKQEKKRVNWSGVEAPSADVTIETEIPFVADSVDARFTHGTLSNGFFFFALNTEGLTENANLALKWTDFGANEVIDALILFRPKTPLLREFLAAPTAVGDNLFLFEQNKKWIFSFDPTYSKKSLAGKKIIATAINKKEAPFVNVSFGKQSSCIKVRVMERNQNRDE